MLAAVSPSGRFENLGGGYRSAASNPVSFGGNAPGVRQAVSPPNSILPGVQNPIKNSSARPTRGTNVTIPYARLAFNLPAEMNPPIEQGEVLFVMRPSGPVPRMNGGSPNYTSTVLSLDRLNKILATDRNAVMAAGSPFGKFGVDAKGDKVDNLTHAEKWKNCKTLAAFTLDGVALSVDDAESESTNLGILFNVAVSGPAQFKRCDNNSHTLHRVFIGLFAQELNGGPGYRFKYVPFTESQLMNNNGKAMDISYENLVSVTVLGRVLDTHSTARTSTRPMMTVNVNPREISIANLQKQFSAVNIGTAFEEK